MYSRIITLMLLDIHYLLSAILAYTSMYRIYPVKVCGNMGKPEQVYL